MQLDREVVAGWRTQRFTFAPSLLLVFLFFATACGKVGAPQPPFVRIPEPVRDLAVTQSGYNLVLTWTNPAHYIDGSPATNLARVQINLNGQPFASAEAAGPAQPQSYVVPVASAIGSERTFTLVVETTQGKTSDISNSSRVVPVDVPGTVTNLNATADQRRIVLRWEAPREHPELADAYIVTRADLPAEAGTVTDTRYEDARFQAGQTLTYQVTAARRAESNMVIGMGPAVVTVVASDKTAPAVPAGLDVTESDSGAYITWNPNAETDLAGYRLFRSDRPDSGFTPLSGDVLTRNFFFDPSYRPGLHYAVSAVDELKNESAMSAPFPRF